MFENSGAVKQNIATKDSMKKLVVDELTVWFGNVGIVALEGTGY